jgi:hypothetical protein
MAVDFWAQHISTNQLSLSTFTLPTVDGSAGWVLATNGVGVWSFVAPLWISAPSSTVNAVPRFSNVSGALASTAATCTAAGVMTTTGLQVGAVTYPSVDGAANTIMKTNGAGVLSLATGPLGVNCQLWGSMVLSSQTTNLAANDHIKFDTTSYSYSTKATLDTSSPYSTAIGDASVGRISLTAGLTYSLECYITNVYFLSGNTATIVFQWYNSTSGTLLGTPTTIVTISSNTQGNTFGYIRAIITPAVTTNVEVRIVGTPVNINWFRNSYFTVRG